MKKLSLAALTCTALLIAGGFTEVATAAPTKPAAAAAEGCHNGPPNSSGWGRANDNETYSCGVCTDKGAYLKQSGQAKDYWCGLAADKAYGLWLYV